MGNSVLLVHRDERIRDCAASVLRTAGYDVDEVADFPPAGAGQSDVIVTLWNGRAHFSDWLSQIRARESVATSRIIIMAPREQLGAAAELMEDGVDDCIGVPFAAAELLSRIRACLRRPAAAARRQQLSSERVVLDVVIHRVLVDGRPIELAPTEFRLLAFFLENQGRVFSRDELLRRAWAKNIKAGLRTVDVHVRRLRQQLEPFGCEGLIQTVRGFGYRFAAAPPGADSCVGDGLLAGSGRA